MFCCLIKSGYMGRVDVQSELTIYEVPGSHFDGFSKQNAERLQVLYCVFLRRNLCPLETLASQKIYLKCICDAF